MAEKALSGSTDVGLIVSNAWYSFSRISGLLFVFLCSNFQSPIAYDAAWGWSNRSYTRILKLKTYTEILKFLNLGFLILKPGFRVVKK